MIDESSIYYRALSASEIKAIYQKGTAGKYDPALIVTSPAQSLAEAQVSLTKPIRSHALRQQHRLADLHQYLYGFTNQTTLILAGVEPGMLLGPLVLTSPVLATNVATNIYYLTFTENTNLTTTPIKFAPPPFVPSTLTNQINPLNDGFEQATAGDYTKGTTFGNGWIVTNNQVSVVTDPATANEGSNYLALASGTIFTNLPTVTGQKYTLTFAYRGPGIASFWRAETSANDSVDGNNGFMANGATYATGEVGKAFNFNGVNQYVNVPRSSSLNSFANQMAIDFWMFANPNNLMNGSQGLVTSDYYGIEINSNSVSHSGAIGVNWYVNTPANAFQTAAVNSGGIPVARGTWQHIAGIYDGKKLQLYTNGVPAGISQSASGAILPMLSSSFLAIGSEEGRSAYTGRYFWGLVDEASIYYRALSASEIKAIYAKGPAGKFDPVRFASSPAQSLAEAQVSLNGQSQGTLYGNNTTWQVETITFTATQNATPLSISGLEPGMLLDAFALTQVTSNLYTLPEQSLSAFTGESALGLWQLEIQDDRAGASLTNALVSWELQFVFANTNAVPLVLGGGIGQTNQFMPAGGIAWYQVNVPANASYATNRLLFASAPVNIWFDTNSPSATNIMMLLNQTSRSVLLSTTNAANRQQPPEHIPGPDVLSGRPETERFHRELRRRGGF